MTTVNHGAVRQIWLAHTGAPETKYPFLVRDDAYSEKEAVFGKTIRLGDPVDLGPFGQWRQTNWSGGHDQETWRDVAMYELGTADVSERKGTTKLWNGWWGIFGYCEPNDRIISHLVPAAAGLGDSNPLLIAERVRRPVPGGDGTGNYRLWKHTPSPWPGGTTELIHTFTSEIQAIGAVGDVSGASIGFHLVGLRDGTVHLYNQNTGAVALEFTVPPSSTGNLAVGYHSICSFNNGTYYTADSRVYRRVGPSTSPTHTHLTTLPEVRGFNSVVVWNNRLWMLGIMSQGHSGLFTSDGFSFQLAALLPGNFSGIDLCVHYGALYIRGIVNHAGAIGSDTRTQLYRYSGAAMTLLWEDDYSDIDYATCGGLTSWGRHLVWPKFGSTSMGRDVGVWMYDAEEDAIYQGPVKTMDDDATQGWVTALVNWNNNITAAFFDDGEYTTTTNQDQKLVAFVNRTLRPRAIKLDGTSTVDTDDVKDSNPGSLTPSGFNSRGLGLPHGVSNPKEQVILSSNYDGNLPEEDKTWAKGYLRCRVPTGCEVDVAMLLNDDPTEHPVQSVTYNGDSGWREVRFSAVCEDHGIHHQSSRIRYKLYLRNTNPASWPTRTPEVDVVGFDFLPAVEPRIQYHCRVFTDDGQADLAGDPNPLATREAMEAKLKQFLSEGSLLFWPATADGTEPDDEDGVPVKMSDYIAQPYRIDTITTEVAGEVSFNLLEIA